ncbi:MAG: LysM peptidoglycan-binding domain-containing protein [Zoogloeaceae bacterium]|jgi:membrane-bound lytic murein transglycosylase D|nr:LysM peptidoglycan-binding domain-containing protein [Zoogloeaceae bacterium]
MHPRPFSVLRPLGRFAFFLLSASAALPGLVSAAESVDADAALPVVVEEVPPPLRIPQVIDLTAPTTDLWARIRNGFAMPPLNDEIVLRQQQYYQSHPEYLRRMVERSRLYLHHIVDELEQRGMPTELALLPMVESAYNPIAQSPAQASGLWQFIPSTGRIFRLEQNWWQDQRRDIVASTSAALDYLQYLYELRGDWHLALASYNWGEGAVGRAMAKNVIRKLPTDFLSLTLPPETRNYVPKLQALRNIFANPDLMAELGIPEVPNEPYFRTLTTDVAMDVELAARFAGMRLEEFAALNPAHNRPVIPAQSTLVLPSDRLERFGAELARHDAPLTNWQVYAVQAGEKLEDVAPRFGIALADLKRVNGLYGGAIQVNPGFTLLVPAQGEADLLEHKDFLTLAEQGGALVAAPGRIHVVRKGETLMGIARKYKMTLSALKKLNRSAGNKLRIGERLTISPANGVALAQAMNVRRSAAPSVASKAQKPAAANKPSAQTRVTHYKVRKGDTLFSIARRYRVNLADLKRWNRLAGNNLRVGTTLTIPM